MMGKFLMQIGYSGESKSSRIQNLRHPSQPVYWAKDHEFVADHNARRVQAFTLDGKFLKEGWVSRVSPLGDFGTAFAVALSGDKAQRFLYVTDGHNERVQVLDRQTLAQISGAEIDSRALIPESFSTSM